jgi:hypothetical protein
VLRGGGLMDTLVSTVGDLFSELTVEDRISQLLDDAWAEFREEDLFVDWDDDRRNALPVDAAGIETDIPEPRELAGTGGTWLLPLAMASDDAGFDLYYDWRQSQDSLAGQLDYNAVGWGNAAMAALEASLDEDAAYLAYWEWTVDRGGTPVEPDELDA